MLSVVRSESSKRQRETYIYRDEIEGIREFVRRQMVVQHAPQAHVQHMQLRFLTTAMREVTPGCHVSVSLKCVRVFAGRKANCRKRAELRAGNWKLKGQYLEVY